MKKLSVLAMLIMGICLFSSCNSKPSIVGLWYMPNEELGKGEPEMVCFFEDGTSIVFGRGYVDSGIDYEVRGNTFVIFNDRGEEEMLCEIKALTKDELHIFGENENGNFDLRAKKVH